jgi:molecular chaperone GrpE
VTHFSEPSAEERLAGQQVGRSSDEPAGQPDGQPHGQPAGQVDGSTAAAEEGSQAATSPGGTGETPEQMAARLQELTADLQRLQAEYVNYKRRVDRDRELVLQNAKFTVLSSLLPVLDDVDRAREHEELDGGFKAIAEALERIVSGEGLVKFGASGDPFDPRLHEALMHSLSPDVVTTTCDKVVQAGYQFGDRVVRPALVTVVDPDPAAPAAGGAEAPADGAAPDTSTTD